MGEHRSISELWEISRRICHEIEFQSLFSIRTGGGPLQEAKDVFKKPPKNLTFLSKFLQPLVIAIFNFFQILVAMELHSKMGILASVYYVSIMLCLIIYFFIFDKMWWIVNLISSRVSEFLITLPLSMEEVLKILLMSFIRAFEVSLAITTIIIPITYGVLYGSILGAFLVLLSVVTAEIFGMSIAVFFASLFYFKVLTRGKSVLRIIYTILWSIPFLFVYFVINFTFEALYYALTLGRDSPILAFLYPLSFGFLASYATSINSYSLTTFTSSLFSSFAYLIMAAISLKWFTKTIGNVGCFRTASGFFRGRVKEISIKPSKPWLGIVKKDLKIILGSPFNISTILLMPFGFTILIGLMLYNFSTMGEGFYLETSGIPLSFVILLFIILLPPLLIALEEQAYSYVGSLPIRKRTLLFSKVFFSFTYYLIIASIFALISIRIPNFLPTILLYSGIGNVPAVFSAIAFLTRQIIKNIGKASFNVRLTISKFTRLFILSIFLATMPSLLKYLLEIVFSETVSIIGFLISSIVEFAIVIILVIKTRE
ncbi:MAG: hypothetical protein FGF52_03070 [Candidatus Brockarchaeota archaeon]|nr:hypothetical protein [Candidatus Brockarchaeota archaeon]